MANPKWTKTEIQLATIADDAIIRVKKRLKKHKPFVITAHYPECRLFNDGIMHPAYTKHYYFAKLQGALDSFKSEVTGWKAGYNIITNPTFALTNTDTGEDLTHLLKGGKNEMVS